MKKRMYRWIYKKAAEVLGDEELNSLKNDLITPVKIAAREAAADIIGDMNGPRSDGKTRE